MTKALRIDPSDNCVVALGNILPGETVFGDIPAIERIPAKHKAALEDLAVGDVVRMYGVTVATASKAIRKGGLLSTANVYHNTESYERREGDAISWDAPQVDSWSNRRFSGFHRSDGQVGTANHWLVIPLVFCENRNLRVMRKALEETLGYERERHYTVLVRRLLELHGQGVKLDEVSMEDLPARLDKPSRYFGNVSGVKFLEHGLGCGGTREDAESLCGLLAGYVTHPNVAGATILSLGCQNAQVSILEEAIAERSPSFDRPLQIFEQQRWQSEQAMLTGALKDLIIGLDRANQAERQPAPLDKLILGMECGGSDGFSGISANPLLGNIADRIVALGGRVILSEFPELCGVEQQLIDRCRNPEDAERFIDLMKRYSLRAEESGSALHMNPSPGNIADGLITDAIKSAGAAKKGGTSPVEAVLDYPQQVRKDGLNLLCTPGGDVESTTAMAGAGANLMLFTTGLGTPTGNPVAPTLKVSSNTDLATRMSDIIDFDAGPIIDGSSTLNQLGDDLLELIIESASGSYTPKAVQLGQDDFLPWKRGVSL